MAVAAAPVNVAAAQQAGVDPNQAAWLASQQQRLAQMLAQMTANGGNNIRTPAALGVNLLADGLLQYGKQKADVAAAGMQQKLAQALYPNDPMAQLRYLVAPEDMNKAAASAYETQNVRGGSTLATAAGGPMYTAPELHDDGGTFSTQTPTGVTITGQRPMNYGEQTAAAAQAETARHNPVQEQIDTWLAKNGATQAAAAMRNSYTNVGNLGVTQGNSPQFGPPGRFSQRVR